MFLSLLSISVMSFYLPYQEVDLQVLDKWLQAAVKIEGSRSWKEVKIAHFCLTIFLELTIRLVFETGVFA